MPALSVIIPTHKRPEVLATCLQYLEKQTIVNNIEVIVVSDDEGKTTEHLEKNSFQLNLIHLDIPPTHQGVARNRGVEKASGDVALFIGDDIFLEPDACAIHVDIHKRVANDRNSEFTALLGYTTWDPSLDITPVMRWLELSGWQFGYPRIAQYASDFIPVSMQSSFTYTSHISLPTSIAREHAFREDVTLYGWEDTEWGLRLKESGVRLLYEPAAKAWHHHHITMEQSLQRMTTLGASAVHISQLVPTLTVLPTGIKRLLYECASLFPTMAGRHRKAFLQGIRQGNDECRMMNYE